MQPKYLYIYRSTDIFCFRAINDQPEPTDFKAHTHLMCEIYLLIRGKAVFHVEGTHYPLHAGDIVVTRPAEAHFVEVSQDEPYERLVINFSPNLLQSIDPETKLLKPFIQRPAGAQNLYRPEDAKESSFLPLIQAIQDSHGDRMTMIANLILLLNQIVGVYDAHLQNQHSPATLEAKILAWIGTNLPRAVTLDELCYRYGISKAQLNRRFKNATGTTVGKYINAKRLMAAQQLIKSGTPPTEVYGQCGFSDYSSFYRAYIKHFKRSPKEDLLPSNIVNEENYKLML